MYQTGKESNNFTIENEFTRITRGVAEILGRQLKPFCFYKDVVQKEYGVLDFCTFQGLQNDGKTLEEDIVAYQKEQYLEKGVIIPSGYSKKLLVYDYLLTTSLCYIEIVRKATIKGVSVPRVDKYLATKNPSIMGEWLGLSKEEMQAKYGVHLKPPTHSFVLGEMKFAILKSGKKGNSISIPSRAYNVDEIRCTPMYLLQAFQKGLLERIQKGVIEVTFLKDNGEKRSVVTTLDKKILMQYYKEDEVEKMIAYSDYDKVQLGAYRVSSTYKRGYLSLPELGSSRFDETGVRGINFNRILKLEEKRNIDTTYINVDLLEVITRCKREVLAYIQKDSRYKSLCYKEIMERDYNIDLTIPEYMKEIEERLDIYSNLYGTEYRKKVYQMLERWGNECLPLQE